MVEKNVCLAGGQVQALQCEPQTNGMGVAVRNAHDVQAIDCDFFIRKNADAGACEHLGVERGVAIFVVVAG
jgi:hypothetical protein